MHSSRMRTVRSSGRLYRGRGSASVHAGIPLPGADTSPRDHAPPHCEQTDTCKNITFATSFAGGKYVD